MFPQLEILSKLLAHRRIPGESAASRHESLSLLSSFTMDDLSDDQVGKSMYNKHNAELQRTDPGTKVTG